ncbi:lipopolysaccharide heptosyltransferase II [Candidatus Omnitrophota bacterium]
MKVLQILPELNVGGVETGTIDLSRYLVDHGHKMVVVSNGGELVKELEKMGVVHYRLPVHRKSLFMLSKMVKELVKIIQRENVDIVHARSRVPGWIAFFATRRTNTVFVTTCHGYYSKHFLSAVMGWGKLVIVPSQVVGKHMIDDFGVPYQRIRLIPRWVALEKFKFKSVDKKARTKFTIGIIGRITPLKGHEYLLKALAKVLRSLPYIKLLIVGDAPAHKMQHMDELKTLVRRLGLTHYVEFLGKRRDIPEILARLNLLVLSTTTEEAFGRVILEAQASGVPVVATRVGGVVDIIEDGKTGLLVPPKSPDAMAEAIVKILKDTKRAQEFSENAYKRVREYFTLDLMAEKTLDAYNEALATKDILVIKLSALGDVMLSIPSLRALRNKFPHARIHCLVGKLSRSILQDCPYIDNLMIYDSAGKHKGIRGIVKIAKELRKHNFDSVIDLQNNRKSHLLSFLSMSSRRYGFDNKKLSFLMNRTLQLNSMAQLPVPQQFRLLELLDIHTDDVRLELWPSKDDDAHIAALLKSFWLSKKEKLIGINLSASKRWLTKSWPIENFAYLCEELGKKGIRVVVTGTEEEAQAAKQLAAMTKSKPLIVVGKTSIMQLASLMKSLSVYITADSAPLHIAAAMEVPVVALFGPTSPLRHMPPAKRHIVIKKDLACSPCYKPTCRTKQCMIDISVQEVVEATQRLLKVK